MDPRQPGEEPSPGGLPQFFAPGARDGGHSPAGACGLGGSYLHEQGSLLKGPVHMGFHLSHEIVPSPCGQASPFWEAAVVSRHLLIRGLHLFSPLLGLSVPHLPQPKVGCPPRLMIGFENHFNLILGKKLPKLFPKCHNGLNVKKANLKQKAVALLLDGSSLESVQVPSHFITGSAGGPVPSLATPAARRSCERGSESCRQGGC